MPIDTRCPHCQKAYRLKDEFLGRKVKCPNPECQKPFAVVPVEAAPKPAAAKKPAVTAEQDAEALAAAMFNDNSGPAAPGDTRTVEMACANCDHKWAVPFEKKGKNVICPECNFLQKVPDKKEKKIDWRDPNADRPSMAKGEEVPEDLRKQMSRDVGTGALVEAGVIKEEIEPLPLAVKLQRIAVVLGAVAALAVVVLYFLNSRQAGKEQRFMDEALAEVEKITDEGMTKGQPPLLKALLLTAAAEHALRNDSPDQRKLAAERFGVARQLLEQQPRSPERDVLLGELAVLIPKFGGDDEQIGKELRLRWQPAGRGAGAQLTAGLGDVQTELLRVLKALNGSDLDLRLSVVRRASRELAKTNHVELLPDIINQGFSEAEMPDAYAHMGLELHRAGNAAGAKNCADQAKFLANRTPALQVLCEVAGVTLKPEEKPYSVPPAGLLSYFNRMYGATLNAVNKDTNAALAVAIRGGPDQADDKLRALAAVADWAENATEAATKADAVLTNEGKGKSNAGYALLRLATAAGKAGQADLADKLIAAIADDGLKAWAKAEAIRAKLDMIKDQKAELSLVDQTTDKGKVRVGHVWVAVLVARHNAAATGDQSAAKVYADWPDGAFKGAGLAGLAVGIQDRKK